MIYAIQQEIQEDAPGNAKGVWKEGRTEDSPRNSTEKRMETLMHKKSGGHVHTGKDRKGKHSHPEYQLKKRHKRR